MPLDPQNLELIIWGDAPADPQDLPLIFGPATIPASFTGGRLRLKAAVETIYAYGAEFSGKVGLRGAVEAAEVLGTGFAGKLRLQAALEAEQRLTPTTHVGSRDVWRAGLAAGAQPEALWADPQPASPQSQLGFSDGTLLAPGRVLPWASSQAEQDHIRTPWTAGEPTSRPISAPWVSGVMLRSVTRVPWDEAVQLIAHSLIPWDSAVPQVLVRALPWRQSLLSRVGMWLPWQPPEFHPGDRELPWDQGLGIHTPGVPVVEDPPTPPELVPVDLHFCRPHMGVPATGLMLFFGVDPCDGTPPSGVIIIPILRSYLVPNSATIIRLPDELEINADSLSMDTDVGGWGWGFSATIDQAGGQLLEPVAGVPREVQVTVNSVVWRFVVEQIVYTREFGRSRAQISGRSPSAYLSEPFAPKFNRTEATLKTAQQLALDELAPPSPAGWTLDWQLLDWTVPANVWTYSQLTPIQAIQRIAEAAGGYVQTHKQLDELSILHYYPEAPWNWGSLTPAYSIPESYIKTLRLQYRQTPEFDGVYVSGEDDGVLTLVRKLGTPGTTLAPTVVDRLMTAVDATVQRGRRILGQTGRYADVQLEFPVGSPLNVVDVGQMLEVYNGPSIWRGIIRGVSIAVQLERGAAVAVRQTVDVERHYL